MPARLAGVNARPSILESDRGDTALRFELPALWLTYAAAAALAVELARRFIGGLSRRQGVLLALLPLVFTGRAMLVGEIYGPADLYYDTEPWKNVAAEQGVTAIRNPILSDLAFANLPWRASVREAFANGRAPLWNRYLLAGNPLLGSGGPAIFHPSTWFGLWLPLGLSWTFSCALTLFLGLICGFLFFRDFGLSARAAAVGAVGWGFSTYMLFWNGWSVGASTASFPLLLLGLRRLAREPGRRAAGITTAALCLSFFGGHPESFFHLVGAGGVYFVWELAARKGREAARSIAISLGAGALALLLVGPQLFPLLETIPHSSEYRVRREALAQGGGRQSVRVDEAMRRLLPAALPFAHGIYGKSPVQASREDGSGMPLGYSGAVLVPLAALAFLPGAGRIRGRWIFLGFFLAGIAYGASFPVLLDVTSRLPGFDMALNYRLVFLAALGLAGLAALGVHELERRRPARSLILACGSVVAGLSCLFALSRSVFFERELPEPFVWTSFAFEIAPLLALGLLALAPRLTGARFAAVALVLLIGQRALEMAGTYPTLPASTLAPPLPTLRALPLGSDPGRIVAAGRTFRPNGAALYGLEDVRGYESIILDRFADTYPLWSHSQAASFNRVEDLSRPFLAFLNVRYAIGSPEDPVPPGWREQARGPEMSVFENPRALPRAFVPRRLRRQPDGAGRLAEMASAADFSETAWLEGRGPAEEINGDATIRLWAVGPDLVMTASAARPVFVATSLPDWPGWVAREGGRQLPIETVNHAFVGLWFPPGEHTVRLAYRPTSWTLGVIALLTGLAATFLLTLVPALARGRTPRP